MNRTALCIQMLMLLKSRDRITSRELADLLQTNPRNIREFRKELETAGYRISEKRGRYGGYTLDDSSTLPVPKLSADEIEDLGQIRSYLDTIDLPMTSGPAARILDKILAGIQHESDPSKIRFIKENDRQISTRQNELIKTARKAISQKLRVQLLYQKKDSDAMEKRIVDPYEVYVTDGIWYLNGWDTVRNGYRNFRFSDQRMFRLEILDQHFLRDDDYHLENYVGSQSAWKGKVEKWVVQVVRKAERSFLELYWGSELEQTGSNAEWIEYKFHDDQPSAVFSALFFLGDEVRLIEPEHRRQEYEEKIASILSLYKKPEDMDSIDGNKENKEETGQS